MHRIASLAIVCFLGCSDPTLHVQGDSVNVLAVVGARGLRAEISVGDALRRLEVDEDEGLVVFSIPRSSLTNAWGEVLTAAELASLTVRPESTPAPSGSCRACQLATPNGPTPLLPGDACPLPRSAAVTTYPEDLGSTTVQLAWTSLRIDVPGDCSTMAPDITPATVTATIVLPAGAQWPVSSAGETPERLAFGSVWSVGTIDENGAHSRALPKNEIDGRVEGVVSVGDRVWMSVAESAGTTASTVFYPYTRDFRAEPTIRAPIYAAGVRGTRTHLLLAGYEKVTSAVAAALAVCTTSLSCAVLHSPGGALNQKAGERIQVSSSGIIAWRVNEDFLIIEREFEPRPSDTLRSLGRRDPNDLRSSDQWGVIDSMEGPIRWRYTAPPKGTPSDAFAISDGWLTTCHRVGTEYELVGIAVDGSTFEGEGADWVVRHSFAPGEVCLAGSRDGTSKAQFVSDTPSTLPSWVVCEDREARCVVDLESPPPPVPMTGLHFSQDRLFLAGADSVFVRSQTGFELVYGTQPVPPVYGLASIDSTLWMVGPKTVTNYETREAFALEGCEVVGPTIVADGRIIAAGKFSGECLALVEIDPENRTTRRVSECGPATTALTSLGHGYLLDISDEGKLRASRDGSDVDVDLTGELIQASWQDVAAVDGVGFASGAVAIAQLSVRDGKVRVRALDLASDVVTGAASRLLVGGAHQLWVWIRGTQNFDESTGQLYSVVIDGERATLVEHPENASAIYRSAPRSGPQDPRGMTWLDGKLVLLTQARFYVLGSTRQHSFAPHTPLSFAAHRGAYYVGMRSGQVWKVTVD